ncbi:hypothetical protein CRENBAI_019028 [Crenichthys baileyi]|uniref:Uncharacterized protein n=1 Tax=Crenichthys baileyi TaxID=28760 RepID=A0AAV9RXQ5_9TELE
MASSLLHYLFRPAPLPSEPSGLHLRCGQADLKSFSGHLSLPSFPKDLSFLPPWRIILQHPSSRSPRVAVSLRT